MTESSERHELYGTTGHSRWVRATHWLVALSFLALAVSGHVILMCHPRLYWGEVGNNLTPALFELPISRNHQHGGWEKSVPFFQNRDSPVRTSREYDIFNMNSWGRSLHFLAAWFLVVPGVIYFLAGIVTAHFRRHLLPRAGELAWRAIWQDVMGHIRLRVRPATGGPQYGLLQKTAYCCVVFLAMPLAGRWVGEVTWTADWPGQGKKGDKVTAYTENKLVEDGNAIITKSFAGNGSSSSLIVYDAGTKQIKALLLNSGGTVMTNVYSKLSPTKWACTTTGSLASGSRIEGKYDATITENGNVWTWTGTTIIGGKKQDDLRDVWRRVSNK